MHAWLCENPTGVDAVAWKELPTPVPGPGEVLVAIKAASLNFPDLLIVQNKYQMKPTPPFVPGSEFAGVVEAVGDGVRHVKPGDAVAAFSGTGGFAFLLQLSRQVHLARGGDLYLPQCPVCFAGRRGANDHCTALSCCR